MNTERLIELIDGITSEEDRLAVQPKIQELSSNMAQLVSQPGQANSQELVAKSRAAIEGALKDFVVYPAELELLERTDGVQFFTENLMQLIDASAAANPHTPTTTKQLVDKLIAERTEYLQALRQISKNLKTLGFEPYPLEEGECELGFEVPRSMFSNNLQGFSEDLSKIDKIIKAVSLAVTGTTEHSKLAQVSTTDPTTFVTVAAPVAVAIAGSITWALNTYKQILEIREVRDKLKRLDLPTKEIDEKIEERIMEAVDKRVAELTQPAVDQESKLSGDVEAGLRWAVKELFARVERGMRVELRLAPIPPKNENEVDSEHKSETEDLTSELEELRSALLFPRVTTGPIMELEPPPQAGTNTNDD